MIDATNLTFTYPNAAQPALKDLSFEVAEGEIFGFLGPSGSGKTTTQKLLIGLLKGYEGDVSVLGRDAKRWGADLYRQVGVGFELPNHFSQLTGRENLQLFGTFHGGKAKDPMELLDLVGLADAADQRVKNYSKGMAMRLNFVRAIMHDPPLLFLDEPTAGLDPGNARKLKDMIVGFREAGKTVFLTTHNMHDADELCDRVAFIVDGQLRAVDSPRALKLAHGKGQVTVEYLEDGTSKSAAFDLRGLHENQAFQDVLAADEVQTIHSGEATLEDVFLETTGRSLR